MSEDAGTTSGGPDARDVLRGKIDEECFGVFLSRRLAQLTPEQVRSARRWFAERIAERAVEIVKEKNNVNDAGENS